MAEKSTKLNKKIKRINKLFDNTQFWKGTALILFGVIVFTQFFDVTITPKLSFLSNPISSKQASAPGVVVDSVKVDTASLANIVIPEEGVVLPINWGEFGKRMIADGVIDEAKFRALFEGGLTSLDEQMLAGKVNQPVVLTQANSRFILDMLWAFGLSNKNEILEQGDMTDEKYGGDASKFASTGGWSLAKGAGFDHYSKYSYVTLNQQQQAAVEEVSRNIYRPCCGNSTYFPDCNHGMAMLGLLELMAKNEVSQQDMYAVALKVNSIWFPQTYIDLATYFKEQGKDWQDVDPKIALSADYSSAQGYQQTRQNIRSLPKPQQGGGSCGA